MGSTAKQMYNIGFKADLGNLGKIVEEFKKTSSGAKGLTDELTKIGSMPNPFANLGNNGSLSKIISEVNQLVGALTSIDGAKVMVARSIDSFSVFNQHIARTGALASASIDELTTLSRTAQDLGRTTEYTAAQVASSMSNLALAGFRVNEIVSAMPGLLATATAGATTLGNASTISAQVLRSFHLEANQMNYVAGALTATFTSTNTQIQDLAYTMQYAGADAHELGVSLSELAAATGILGNVGLKGSIAGTGLREFIARIGSTLAESQNGIGNTREALKQLGITWKDVSDEAGNLNLVRSVSALEKAFESMGMKAEERLKALRPIFGARAGSQVTALVSQGAEVLAAKDMEVAFGGAKQQLDGLLQSAARLPEGMHGIIVSSKEIAENFIRIGSQGRANLDRVSSQMREMGLVGGFLNSQVGVTKDIIERINGETIKRKVFVPMEDLGTSTLRSIDALYRLKDRLNEIGSQAERLTILQDLFGSDPRIMEQATRAMEDGGQAMATFANSIIRATSALDVQKKQLDTVKGSMDLMESAFEGMRIQLGAVLSPIARILAMSLAGVAQLVAGTTTLMGLLADFQENLGGIESQLLNMRSAFVELSAVGKALAVGLLVITAVPLLSMLAAIWGSLSTIVPFIIPALMLIGGLLARIFMDGGRLFGLLGKYTTEFQDMGSAANGIGIVFRNIPRTIAGIGAAIKATGWAAVIEALVYTAYDLIPAIVKGFTDIASKISSFGDISFEGLGGIGGSMGEMQMTMPDGGVLTSFVDNLSYVIDGIVLGLEYLVQVIIRAGDAIMQTAITATAFVLMLIIDIAANIPMLLFSLFKGVVSLLQKIIGSIFNIVVSLMLTFTRTIIGFTYYFLNTIYEYIKASIRQILSALRVLIVEAPTMLVNTMLHIVGFLTNVLGHIGTIMIDIGSRIIANTINWTAYLFATIVKITTYVALLPITLPYLFYRATILIFNVLTNRLQSGGGVIADMVKGILTRLKEIASNFLNSIMAGIVRQLKDIFNTVFNILGSLLNIPGMLFGIAAMVYESIAGALGSIYHIVVSWLDRLPYTIAGLITRAWSLIFSIISNIISFFGNIIRFVGTLIIKLVSYTFKAFAALVTELPYLVLRIVVYGFNAFVAGMLNTIAILVAQVKGIVFNLISNFHIYFTTQIRRVFILITNGIPNLMANLRNAAATAVKNFGKFVTSVVEELPAWLEKSIIDLAVWLRDKVLTLPMAVVEGTLEALNNAFDIIMGVIDNIINGLTSMSTSNMETAQGKVVQAAIQFLMDFPGLMINAIARAWDVFVEGMKKISERIKAVDWDVIGSKIGNALKGIGNKIISSLLGVWDTLLKIARGGGASFTAAVRDWFGIKLSKLPGLGAASISKMFQNIVDAVKPQINSIISLVQGMWTTIKGIDWWGIIIEITTELYKGIQLWINKARTWLNDLPTDGIWGIVKEGVGGVLDIIQAGINMGLPMLKAIRSRWDDLMKALYSGLTGGVSLGIKFVVGGFMVLGGVLLVIGRIAWAAVQAISGVSSVFGDMAKMLETGDYVGFTNKIMDTIQSLAKGDYTTVAKALGEILVTVMQTAVELAAIAFYGVYKVILARITDNFPIIGGIINVVIQAFYYLGVVFVGLLRMADWATGIFGVLADIIMFIIAAVGLAIKAALMLSAAIVAFITGITDIPGAFNKIGDAIMDSLHSLWTKIKSWLPWGSSESKSKDTTDRNPKNLARESLRREVFGELPEDRPRPPTKEEKQRAAEESGEKPRTGTFGDLANSMSLNRIAVQLRNMLIGAVKSAASAVLSITMKVAAEIVMLPYTMVKGAVNGIITIILLPFRVINALINGLSSLLYSVVSGIINYLIWAFIQGGKDVLGFITWTVKLIVGLFVSGAKTVWSIIAGLSSAIFASITGLGGAILGVFTSIGSAILNVFIGIANIILGVFTGIGHAISGISNAILNIFTSTTNSINGAMGSVTTNIQNAFSSVMNIISAAMNFVTLNIQSAFNQMINIFSTIINTTVNLIVDTVNFIFSETVRGTMLVITTVQNTILGIMNILSTWMSSSIQLILDTVTFILSATVRAGTFIITTIQNTIFGIISSVSTGMTNSAQLVIDTVNTVLSTMVSGAMSAITTIQNTIFEIINIVSVGMVNSVQLVVDTVNTVLSAMASGAIFVITTIQNTILGVISIVSAGMVNSAQLVVDTVNTVLITMASGAMFVVENIQYVLSEIVNTLATGMIIIPQFFADVINDIINFLTSTMEAIPRFFSDLGDEVMAALASLWDRATSLFSWGGGSSQTTSTESSSGGSSSNTQLIKTNTKPHFAEGGIIQRETNAVLGEKGPEAVLPLGGLVEKLSTSFMPMSNLLIGINAELVQLNETLQTAQNNTSSGIAAAMAVMLPALIGASAGLAAIASLGMVQTVFLSGINAAMVLMATATSSINLGLAAFSTAIMGSLQGIIVAIGVSTQAIVTGQLASSAGQGLLTAGAGAGAGAVTAISTTAGLGGFMVTAMAGIKVFLGTILVPFAILIAKIGLIIALVVGIVGLITMAIEWLFNTNLGGFFGLFKSIWASIIRMKDAIFKKLKIKTEDKKEKKDGPRQATIAEKINALVNRLRITKQDDALNQLQKLYIEAQKRVTEQKEVVKNAKTPEEKEAAEQALLNAQAKFATIAATTRKLFNTSMEETRGLSKEERDELYKNSAENFYKPGQGGMPQRLAQPNNVTIVNIQANNEDPAKINTIVTENMRNQNRGNVASPSSRGSGNMHPGKTVSPVVHSSQPVQRTHKK